MHPRTAVRLSVLASIIFLAVTPAAALAARQVVLRPAAGAAGGTVVLRGSGFPHSHRVLLRITGRRARSIKSSRTGAFTARFAIPSAARGWLSVVSRSGRGGRVLNRFLVTSGSQAGQVVEIASSGGARLRMSPAQPAAGDVLRMAGFGFPAGRRIAFSVAGIRHTIIVPRKGRFRVTLTLPSTLPARRWPLVLRGHGIRLVSSVRVTGSPQQPGGQGDSGGGGGGSSAATAPPVNTAPPSITGVANSGHTVTADRGSWTGSEPIGYAYSWQRCNSGGSNCATIAGATASSYVVSSSDAGSTLRVMVTATNPVGSASASSRATAVVKATPTNTALPGISGTPTEGATLNVTKGQWSGTTPISYAYAWQRCDSQGAACVAIAGAASSSYTARSADVGYTLRAAVTATNAAGSTTATSNATAVVNSNPTLVALWHMDEISGGVMTDSVGGNDGTLHSITLGQPGFQGTAYALNGSSSHISVPSASALNPGDADITITIHMATTNLPNAQQVEDWDLIRKGTYANDPGEFKMEYYPSGQASCGFKGSLGYAEVIDGPALNDGQWHAVQCVKTASSIALVVDGHSYPRAATIGSITNTAPLIVGSHAGTSEFFGGLLDEASITVG